MNPLYRRASIPRLALLFLTVPFGSLAGQGALLEGRMAVDLPMRSGPVHVSMDYWVLPDSLGREMELTVLITGAARLDSARASVEGIVVPFRLEEIRPGYWSGTVPVQMAGAELGSGQRGERGRERFRGGSGFPADTVHIRLTYVVTGAWEGGGRVVVPAVASGWVPSDPHPKTFVGNVNVPPGLTILESFPTSVVTRPEGGEGGVYQVSLQGVPAMIALRVVEGEAPFFTLERLLDILVVFFLLVMGAAGVRFLRRQDK